MSDSFSVCVYKRLVNLDVGAVKFVFSENIWFQLSVLIKLTSNEILYVYKLDILVTFKLRDCKISIHIIDACTITWIMLALAHYFSWRDHFYICHVLQIHSSRGVAASMKFSSRLTVATCRCSVSRAAGWWITHAADIGKTNTVGQYKSSIHLKLPSWE